MSTLFHSEGAGVYVLLKKDGRALIRPMLPNRVREKTPYQCLIKLKDAGAYLYCVRLTQPLMLVCKVMAAFVRRR
jgi:hypothetical protein